MTATPSRPTSSVAVGAIAVVSEEKGAALSFFLLFRARAL
jgi:hypothetical protein